MKRRLSLTIPALSLALLTLTQHASASVNAYLWFPPSVSFLQTVWNFLASLVS